jgi:hypothetical protein
MGDEQPRANNPWAKTSSGDADNIATDDDQEDEREARPPDESTLAERARTSRAETEELRHETHGDEEDDASG